MHKLEINETHEITSKIQALKPQFFHKTIHGKRILGSKNQAYQGYG